MTELTEQDWADWREEVYQFFLHRDEDLAKGILSDPPFEPTPKAVREAAERSWRLEIGR